MSNPVYDYCLSKSPDRLWYCEKDADHEGDHVAFENSLKDQIRWSSEDGHWLTTKELKDEGLI